MEVFIETGPQQQQNAQYFGRLVFYGRKTDIQAVISCGKKVVEFLIFYLWMIPAKLCELVTCRIHAGK